MRRAFTVIGCMVLAGLLCTLATRADDRGTDQPGLPIVVDSRGKVVGTFYFVGRLNVPTSSVLRKIDGAWYLLPFSARTGFSSTGVQLFYATADCTGTAYVAASPDNLVMLPLPAGATGVVNGILYYPKAGSIKPSSSLVIKSQKVLNFEGKSIGCGGVRAVVMPQFVGEMKTFELSKLGFVPPFTMMNKESGFPGKPLRSK